MNLSKHIFYLLTLTALFFSCRTNSKYPYTIKDFDATLQPHLIKIVSSGIVGYSPSEEFVEKHATDKDLIRLSQSEHPILRAVALREIRERPSIDNFKQLMMHLDDTAVVTVDRGEFGTDFRTVTDDFISFFEFSNLENKNKAVDKVITEHNYLRSAYTALSILEPKENYYKHIKEMALRDVPFDDLEKALYRLASYRKKEDIELIKNKLLQNHWKMEQFSFRLMKEFPDPTYLEVLDKYAKRRLHSTVFEYKDVTTAKYFFETLAAYKQKESVDIFQFILKELRPLNCYVDTSYINRSLLNSIWSNDSEAYTKIREQIKPQYLYHERHTYKHTSNEDGITETNEPPAPIWW